MLERNIVPCAVVTSFISLPVSFFSSVSEVVTEYSVTHLQFSHFKINLYLVSNEKTVSRGFFAVEADNVTHETHFRTHCHIRKTSKTFKKKGKETVPPTPQLAATIIRVNLKCPNV